MQTLRTDERSDSHEKSDEIANLHGFTPRQRDPIRWLVGCGLALIVAIVAGTAIMVSNYRENTIAANVKELESAIEILAGHFDQELSDFAVVQNVLARRTTDIAKPDDFRRLISTSEMHIWQKPSWRVQQT